MAGTGMSEDRRDLLKKYRVALVEDLEPSKLLVYLSEVLDAEDVEIVKVEKIRTRQAETLLDMLLRRGPNAFDAFVSALQKKQPHLAEMLLKDSGLSLSASLKDDHQMSKRHREILCSNADKLRDIDLERILPLMSILLDQDDKTQILSGVTETERVEKLLLDILPKKGPSAFEHFVRVVEQVNSSMAQPLLKDAGMEKKVANPGSSNGSITPKEGSVQDTGSFTLDNTVQDVLETNSQVFDKFCDTMDIEDGFGNGWRRLYKELGLPLDKMDAFEEKKGSPTLNIIKAWCTRNGRLGTVQRLMKAVYRSERGDGLYTLEKYLGCRMDDVDSGVDDVTRGMNSLRAGEDKKVRYLGDLTHKQASVIALKLDEGEDCMFRSRLEAKLNLTDSKESSVNLLMKSKQFLVRDFSEFLRSNGRLDVIETMKSALPKGVTGPLLSPDVFVRNLSYSSRAVLTRNLSGDAECWKKLAEALDMDISHIRFLDDREKNPADNVLRFWEVKQNSTVGRLYDILVDIGYPLYADLL